MIKPNICPYCDGPYTLADGGCRAKCRVSQVVVALIRAAIEDDERRDPADGEP
jgi:hypothetical protein